ncbi:hypothetical protein QBC45DRAFT_138649 [Copromyces sp. CBS 386.78]|nr:hypothetical protein QBC45DRAFT_138649 [Copromyces sp. CBS 386.78]
MEVSLRLFASTTRQFREKFIHTSLGHLLVVDQDDREAVRRIEGTTPAKPTARAPASPAKCIQGRLQAQGNEAWARSPGPWAKVPVPFPPFRQDTRSSPPDNRHTPFAFPSSALPSLVAFPHRLSLSIHQPRLCANPERWTPHRIPPFSGSFEVWQALFSVGQTPPGTRFNYSNDSCPRTCTATRLRYPTHQTSSPRDQPSRVPFLLSPRPILLPCSPPWSLSRVSVSRSS